MNRNSQRLSRQFLVVYSVLAVILLVAAACNSGDGSDEQTPTITPTVEVLPTTVVGVATATPTVPAPTVLVPSPTATAVKMEETQNPSTATSGIELPALSLTDVDIEQCRLSGRLRNGGVSGQGTAPAPTPTPAPPDSSRDPVFVVQEMRVFAGEIEPVIASLVGYSDAFQLAWPHADTTEKQAAQLQVFGNRLAQLCSAVSQVDIPPEVFGETVGLGESMRVSHAWVTLAIDEINCCGTAQNEFFDVGHKSTSNDIERATSVLSSMLGEYVGLLSDPLERVVDIERFGLQMTVDEAAVVVRNSVDVVVIFPDLQEILDPASLGVASWTFGTGIRIRRLRNSPILSVERAVVEYRGLIAGFGEPEQSSELDFPLPDGIQFGFPALENGWLASAVVWVSDGFTYFFESICQPGVAGSCERIERSTESIRVAQ